MSGNGWIDSWICENQQRSNLRTLKHMVGMTVGLTKTNRFPNLIHEQQRLDWQLDLRKPTAFQPSYLKAHGWNDGWIDENQPFSNPYTWAATVGLTVGFAKTNSVPIFVPYSTWLEWRLDWRKPTVLQPSYMSGNGWIDSWICENQPRSNLRTLKHMVGMTVGLTKTNRFPTLIHERQRLEWRLDWRKPTVFQPSYMSGNGWINSWICENQQRSNLRTLTHMVVMTIGLTKTNLFAILIHERQRLDWQLDLRKPTAFQSSYRKAHGWNDGWIDKNQPFSKPHTWAATVGLTVGFAKPTAFQHSYLKAHGWNDGWIDENQPFPNPHTWAATVRLTVGFAKTNRVPTFVYLSQRLELRLVLRTPTPFQLLILKSTVGMTVGFAKTNRVPTFVP